MDKQNSSGSAIVLIIHALLWAALMLAGSFIFKDRPWADDLLMWMVAGFVLTNGLVLSATGRKRRC